MIKENIFKAYEFACTMHEGQKRKFTDLPYITHPKAVARILEKYKCDEEFIITALLHDIIEDTTAVYEDVKKLFGKNIAYYVFELTSDKSRYKLFGSKANYLINKISYMSELAFTVKLADRLHNIMYLTEDKTPFQFIKKYFDETVTIIKYMDNKNETSLTYLLYKRIEIELYSISYIFDFDYFTE